MPAGNWIMVNTAKKYLMDGTIDFDTDDIRMALFNSSLAPSVAGLTTYSTTNEIAQANGYTRGGQALANKVVAQSGSTTRLTADNVTWNATGGSIAGRWAMLYKKGTANGITDPVIGYCLLDTTPADVTATDGNPFTITTPANGFFTFTGAAS